MRCSTGSIGVEIDDHVVEVDEQMMTGHAGLFAGGDMVPAERMAAVAIGHGRRAARCIDGWLGTPRTSEPPHEARGIRDVNPWYYTDAPRQVRPQLEDVRRQSTFEEVVKGWMTTRRCSRLGAACRAATASRATTASASARTTPCSSPGRRGEPYAFDLDYCKGCGICAAECPCGAIEMVPEEI